MPALQKCVQDRSPAVRSTLARLLGFLLRARPDRSGGLHALGLEPLLLFLLLNVTRDATDEVREGGGKGSGREGKGVGLGSPGVRREGSAAVIRVVGV